MYHSKHADLLARLSAIAQARNVAIEQATEKRRKEMRRHEDEMRAIRELHESMNLTLAAALEEAARKKVKQQIICDVVGLSRTRLHQLRRGAK